MVQYKAFDDNVKVNGETVLSVVEGMGVFKKTALDILSKNGISNPQPGQWYSQQEWLNAFKTISDKIGNATLYSIGKKIPRNAKFPPEISTVSKALESIDIAYHMNHRGGDIGCYRYKKISNRSAKIICNNPHPCDFDQGIIEAMVERFNSAKSHSCKIKHSSPQECRKNGSDFCEYIVEW